MITRQRQAVGTGTLTSPAPKRLPTSGAAGAEGPAWLWESLRYRFWKPADLAPSMRRVGLEPERRAVAAWWWSLLTAADQLGSRMYAAAFVRATERHDSDQVRWSLLAMLRERSSTSSSSAWAIPEANHQPTTDGHEGEQRHAGF